MMVEGYATNLTVAEKPNMDEDVNTGKGASIKEAMRG
jgi:hypothetical protein